MVGSNIVGGFIGLNTFARNSLIDPLRLIEHRPLLSSQYVCLVLRLWF